MRVGYPDTMNRKEASPLKARYASSGDQKDLEAVSIDVAEKDPAKQEERQERRAERKDARTERRGARKASGDKTAAGEQIEKVGKGVAKVGKSIGAGIKKLFGG
jgi:hypothetical protein